MRPSLLFALFIWVAFSPLSPAKSPKDGGARFVAAYLKAQRAEKEEQAGNLDLALAKLQKASRMLDKMVTKFPHWSPAIVNYRKARIAGAIARVQYEIAKIAFNLANKSSNGGASAQKDAAVPEDLTDRQRQLLKLAKRIKDLEELAPDELSRKGWGEQYDPGIFVPLENPRWRGW